MSEALVLGGGGVAGIAWITGLLAGLADAGQDVSGADLLVGTSAGATVAAQLGSGLSLDELYARQADPDRQCAELMAELDMESLGAQMATALGETTTFTEMRRAIGGFSLAADTVPEAERRAVIEGRLPSHEWPERALKIVAVDAETGEPRVFDNASGVSLVDAVAASCAVPGIWPPTTIEGHRYVDGGVRSAMNADYATGASRVLLILPLGQAEPLASEAPARIPRRPARRRRRDRDPGAGRAFPRRHRHQPTGPGLPHPRRQGRPCAGPNSHTHLVVTALRSTAPRLAAIRLPCLTGRCFA